MAVFRYSLLLLVFITSCTLERLKALETGGVCGNPGDSFFIENMSNISSGFRSVVKVFHGFGTSNIMNELGQSVQFYMRWVWICVATT